MNRLAPCLAAALAAFSSAPPCARGADAVARAAWNVRAFGATGDGTTKDTTAFQKALDTCAVHGGGEVLVPAGTYLIGSVQMGNRTILRLEQGAVIAGSPDPEDYPMIDVRWEGRWQPGRRALIYSANVDHTGIYIKTRIGRAGVTENIEGDDLEVLGGGFLMVNLVSGGNTNTADDPVEGPIGYPSARNLSFANVRLTNARVLVEATRVDAEKPVDGLSLLNISGTTAKGITLRHVRNAILRGLNVSGYEGALLAIDDVTGSGLDGAVPYDGP
jgi:polygalacturonase